jgi:hypothetical protein
MARKLRRINESLIGYEPEGREFESLRAHHSSPTFRSHLSQKARKMGHPAVLLVSAGLLFRSFLKVLDRPSIQSMERFLSLLRLSPQVI